MPCANTFAWCAVGEIIDKYNLPWSPPNSKDKNCVALRALNGTNGTTSMAFDNEPSSQNKRAICEVYLFIYMRRILWLVYIFYKQAVYLKTFKRQNDFLSKYTAEIKKDSCNSNFYFYIILLTWQYEIVV